jgi:hypothetical protein
MAKYYFREHEEECCYTLSGLIIKREGKITIAGNWYNHIHGIRPMLRYF